MKPRPFSLASAACFLLLLSFPVARAQEGVADGDEVVKVNSDLVTLNLTVTKSNGEYVHNLSNKDFRVFEDGREQRATLFGEAETPFAAVLLLDASGSMEGRLSLARSAAIRFLDGLRAEDVACVYSFHSKIEMIQDFSSSRDLEPVAYDLDADGYTVLNDAIDRAARELSSRPEKRRAIVVLSDGADTRSRLSGDKALASALAADASIYTVDLSDRQSGHVANAQTAAALKNFSEKTGGRYVASPGGKALRDAFASIIEELSNQYTLTYRPENRARDGKWRTIEVRTSASAASVRTRRGYRAAK